MVFFLLAFGSSFQILEGTAGTINERIRKSFFEQWLLSFGQFEEDDWDTSEGTFIFCLSTGILTLILMNLIIAIMSETYERVMTSVVESDNRQLNTMILQYENMLFWKRSCGSEKHLFWITYSQSSKDEWLS